MPFLSQQTPLTDRNGFVTPTWFGAFQEIAHLLSRAAGENVFTIATQPTSRLGPNDVGYIGLETEFGHLLRWTGTAWEFAPGDGGNGFLLGFPAGAPQAVGYGLCDGTVYTYLVVGATLTTATYDTTPAIAAGVYFRR